MEKWEREHERIEKKWRNVKKSVHPCETCGESERNRILLAHHWGYRLKKFSLECDVCGWCGKRAFTIKSAVRKWNREMKKIHENMP